jgi:hypothetical protein
MKINSKIPTFMIEFFEKRSKSNGFDKIFYPHVKTLVFFYKI